MAVPSPLKCELLNPRSWQTGQEAKSAVIHWTEALHNRRRRHSDLRSVAPGLQSEPVFTSSYFQFGSLFIS
jgi:hypothetical protein